MKLHIEYIEQANGRVIQMPVDDWEKFKNHTQHLQEKLQAISVLKSSFKEIRAIKAGKQKPLTIQAFLDAL